MQRVYIFLGRSLPLYMHNSWRKMGALKASTCNSANTPQPFPAPSYSPLTLTAAPPDSSISAPPRVCINARHWRAEFHASLLMACTNACPPGVQKFTPVWR